MKCPKCESKVKLSIIDAKSTVMNNEAVFVKIKIERTCPKCGWNKITYRHKIISLYDLYGRYQVD